MPDLPDNQVVALDAGRLHSDLMLTNERLKAQQVTLDHILVKLNSMEASFQTFVTSKAVLDERLANEKRRVDEMERTLDAMSKEHEAAKAQFRALWWALGTPVGALLLSTFREHIFGK